MGKMITNIPVPIAINVLAVAAFLALTGFITSRILASAPDIPVPVVAAQHTEALETQEYSGVIAWVNAQEIKITDTFGVSRVFAITADTHILENGFPAGSATYKDLPMLKHVKIVALGDGTQESAQSILVQ